MENHENILKEVKRILFLTEYDPKKVINEQPPERKSFNLGTMFGNKEFNFRGKQRDPGSINFGFSYDKELDEDLNTVGDVMSKMNSELGIDEEYKKLPYNTKYMLATGFFNAITTLVNGQKLPKEDRQEVKKIKKFFKKSQRWKFNITEPEDEIATVDIKIKSSKGDIKNEDELNSILSTSISKLNSSNSSDGTILSKEASYFSYDKTLGDVSTLLLKKSVMSTLFARASKPIKTTEISPEKVIKESSNIIVLIPKVVGEYSAGSSNPSLFFKDIMSTILNLIQNTKVTFGDDTKTIKEMIDCGSENCDSEYVVSVSRATILSSASNTWTGEVLDFTHENNGKKIKDISAISRLGKNPKNVILAKERANNLIQLIMQELGKNSGIQLSNNWASNIDMEIIITDTGGKIDKDRVLSEHPNPGQYSEISIGIHVDKITNRKINSVVQSKGTITQRIIKLNYVGRNGPKIEFDSGFQAPSKEKSIYLRKGLYGLKLLSQGTTRRRMAHQERVRARQANYNRRN